VRRSELIQHNGLIMPSKGCIKVKFAKKNMRVEPEISNLKGSTEAINSQLINEIMDYSNHISLETFQKKSLWDQKNN